MWTSHKMQNQEPVYSGNEIENALKVTAHFNGLWDQFFAHLKVELCKVAMRTYLSPPIRKPNGS
jgi:hypothetical protein